MSGALERLAARGRVLAEAGAARRRRALTEAAGMLGLTARAEGEEVVIAGRGLVRRWLNDARLRHLTWWTR